MIEYQPSKSLKLPGLIVFFNLQMFLFTVWRERLRPSNACANVATFDTFFLQHVGPGHPVSCKEKFLKYSRWRCLTREVSNQDHANLNANFYLAVSAGFKTTEAEKTTHLVNITKVLYKSFSKTSLDFILHHLLQWDVCWHGGVTTGACVPSLGQRGVRSTMWEQERHRCPMGPD